MCFFFFHIAIRKEPRIGVCARLSAAPSGTEFLTKEITLDAWKNSSGWWRPRLIYFAKIPFHSPPPQTCEPRATHFSSTPHTALSELRGELEALYFGGRAFLCCSVYVSLWPGYHK